MYVTYAALYGVDATFPTERGSACVIQAFQRWSTALLIVPFVALPNHVARTQTLPVTMRRGQSRSQFDRCEFRKNLKKIGGNVAWLRRINQKIWVRTTTI